MAQYLDYNGLQTYDTLIKDLINNKTKSYKATIQKGDFSQIHRTGYYCYDIKSTDHKISKPYVAICCDNNSNNIFVDVYIYSNKDICIGTHLTFDGFVIIKEKEN